MNQHPNPDEGELGGWRVPEPGTAFCHRDPSPYYLDNDLLLRKITTIYNPFRSDDGGWKIFQDCLKTGEADGCSMGPGHD